MRVGIVSDIHGNWEALSAVSSALEKERVEEVWCLGDIVGYGPDPQECIKWVKQNCRLTVCGNHDKAVCREEEATFFNHIARKAIMWTCEQLSEEEIRFLDSLPYTISLGEILLVHSSPESPRSWGYILNEWDAERAFENCEERLIFVGHTHRPQAYEYRAGEALRSEFPVTIKLNIRYLINPGSVGQPRDRDPRASFGILEDETFRLLRVEYDIEKTQAKMYERGLPEHLAKRLEIGA